MSVLHTAPRRDVFAPRPRWLWLLLALSCGCDVYDAALSQSLGAQAKGSESKIDGGPTDEASSEASAGRSPGCAPAPDQEFARCQVGCPEICNGLDDDCDGDADEDSADVGCRAQHARASCQNGSCVLTACLDERRDCNQQPDDGCEVAADDPNHCGACDRACRVPHATPVCVDDRCRVLSCDPGYADCDRDGASCETSLASANDCGSCGRKCSAAPHVRPNCSAGECGFGSCEPGYGDCNQRAEDGCERALDTLTDCGGCDTPCARTSCQGGVCSDAACQDRPHSADCDRDQLSCEVDLRTDPLHCGSCERACVLSSALELRATPICRDSSCLNACAPGFGDCDGVLANGCETALDTPEHCGSCERRCAFANAVAACTGTLEARLCAIGSCAANFGDCNGLLADGCERDLRSPATGGQGPCLPDTSCSRTQRGDREYYVCPNVHNWQTARNLCQSQLGGDLALIETAEEASFLAPFLSTRHWIGGNDLAVEGVWIWAGSNLPFWKGEQTGAALNGSYALWVDGEPNGNGDCADLFPSGAFEELVCTALEPFVCEVVPDLCPDDATKLYAGQCGCGRPDTDTNLDGLADCGG